MKNIVVQGLGFVGSAMSIAVASRMDHNRDFMYNVTGIDLSTEEGKERIDSINSGVFPFKTNDSKLSEELYKAVNRGNLIATNDESAYSKADVVLVNINCDLVKHNNQQKIAIESFIKSIQKIADNILEETLVIIESTVPPGTCEKLVYPLFEKTFKKRNLNINMFFLAHSYERVMPGDEYFDSIINYWRVYSGINEKSAKKCELFLSSIVNINKYPLTRLNNTTESETGKLLENSYRAVNIAFIEEWGRFAEDIGVDLYNVINAIRMRPTHSNIRQPGFGVGGYCLTKDPLFAKIAARDLFKLKGHDFHFSSKAIKINADMPLVTLNKLKKYYNGNLKGKNILLMGVTYRQDVGDTRFSPSELFAKEAKLLGADISAYDPLLDYWEEMDMNIAELPNNTDKFDAIVFAVSHKEFNNLSLKKWIKPNRTLLFDANNVLTEKQILEISQNKINYISIGRG